MLVVGEPDAKSVLNNKEKASQDVTSAATVYLIIQSDRFTAYL